MTFEELLRRKLGPMRDLVRRPNRRPPPDIDASALYFRRAVGLDLRVRPTESWARVEVRRASRPGAEPIVLDRADAALLTQLTEFTAASEIDCRPAQLWDWVLEDLLFYSHEPVDAPLRGRTLPGGNPRVSRRRSAWPTIAVETAVEVAPMPFMPRGDDLEGAELVGARFASLERNHEVLGATITGDAALGRVIRELLAVLNVAKTRSEILADFAEPVRADADRLLTLFDELTLLEPAPPGRTDLQGGQGQVTWLGHAAVLVQAGGVNVLFDPLFFSSDPDPASGDCPFDARELPPLDAIFITHGDNDHLNINSLAMLDPNTPIYVPRTGRNPPPYQVDLNGVLRVLGFQRAIELDEGEEIRLGRAVITAFPFEGESWDLDLAKLTFLLEAPELSVFLSADAAAMPATYRALADRPRRVDFAFMGVSGNAETFVMPPGFGYGNFYGEWVPPHRRNEWVQHCAGPREAVESVEIFSPTVAFGYASGGASFIKTEYSDVGSHADFASLLAAANAKTEAVTLAIGEPFVVHAKSSSSIG